ncbi:hypothetical protein YB2330_003943 [Saitoella coloradoensis]
MDQASSLPELPETRLEMPEMREEPPAYATVANVKIKVSDEKETRPKCEKVMRSQSHGSLVRRMFSRQNLFRLFTVALLYNLLKYICVDTVRPCPHAREQEEHACNLTDRSCVDKFLKHHPLIDGHNDLPIFAREVYHNQIYPSNFSKGFEEGGLQGHVDIPRLRTGGVGGQFWSVFVECPEGYDDAGYAKAFYQTMEQIDVARRLVSHWNETFELVDSVAEFEDAFGRGKIASMLGAEGLHAIGPHMSLLRPLREMGVMYMTLTHTCTNPYADSANGERRYGGLSELGRAAIKEMNRIGMMVDLSHVTAETMKDAIEESKAPVMFSHSSAFGVCPHERNVPDDILDMVKAKDGVVMVNFYPAFVRCGDGRREEDATIGDVADHVMHIVSRIGWSHVGIGSDFDGIPTVPKGLEDVSKYPELVKELSKRGMEWDDAKGFVGRNLLRVWKKVEEVREGMKEELPDERWDGDESSFPPSAFGALE